MNSTELENTARALVADGKGILAADETAMTLTKRLSALKIASTTESRRNYREMFFSTPQAAEWLSGVILQDETIHQGSAAGGPLAGLLTDRGIIPGIKVDTGAKPLAGAPGETITEGLDGLRERLTHYRELGARFAKWRAVFTVDDRRPSEACVSANAAALGRYAALCQEQDIVPIVEPEVLMDGSNTIDRCEEVTGRVLHAVFGELFAQHVLVEGMLLKPNMVIAGKRCPQQADAEQVAQATLRCLRRHVPAAVPGIVFLSGGQDHLAATKNLAAINRSEGPKPWKLTFSYGRALQDEALAAWHGDNVEAGQRAFAHRARCDSAASRGSYTASMERERSA